MHALTQRAHANALRLASVLLGSAFLINTCWCGAKKPEGASQAPSKFVIAIVDMQRLLRDYRDFRKADEEYRAEIEARQRALAAREYLTRDEWRELDNLEAREREGKLTEKERKRLKELQQLSQQRRDRVNILMNKKLTDEERKELERLQQIARGNELELQRLNERFTQELDTLLASYLNEHGRRIRAAVQTVAQRYGIKLVVARRGGAEPRNLFQEIVLYADPILEITQEVLSILNAPAPTSTKSQGKSTPSAKK
ncbi:MAG TPA: OmpH family outer membrane protein [Armatimonadetes bacterium]|nr:OmpH family outer membrane protein [Armatimonadota bacterium]